MGGGRTDTAGAPSSLPHPDDNPVVPFCQLAEHTPTASLAESRPGAAAVRRRMKLPADGGSDA